MVPSVERLSRAQRLCLRKKAGGECAPPISTPRLTETFASSSRWVWKSSIHNTFYLVPLIKKTVALLTIDCCCA